MGQFSFVFYKPWVDWDKNVDFQNRVDQLSIFEIADLKRCFGKLQYSLTGNGIGCFPFSKLFQTETRHSLHGLVNFFGYKFWKHRF
jgi:hypothetical protein